MRLRRDAPDDEEETATEEGTIEKVKHTFHNVEHKVEEEIDFIAEKAHMKPW